MDLVKRTALRIKLHKMRNLKTILKRSFTIALMIMSAGCGSTRVIYVKHGEPVRLAESISGNLIASAEL